METYYEHAGITIYHGDCRDIIPFINDQVDLVATDPPYGPEHTHAKHLSTVRLRNGEPAGSPLGFEGLSVTELVGEVHNWVRIARWAVFTCEWKYAHYLHTAGLLVRLGIWRKPDGAPQFTGDRPGMGWEAVAICHGPGRKRWNGGGRHAFWNYPKGDSHPCGKPVGLFRDIVGDFSDPGAVVLDPFMGSGTTLVAAKNLGRRAIGIEIEERYCEIAAKRLSQEVLPFAAISD